MIHGKHYLLSNDERQGDSLQTPQYVIDKGTHLKQASRRELLRPSLFLGFDK